jgi:pyochelin biosynthesis protein PchC
VTSTTDWETWVRRLRPAAPARTADVSTTEVSTAEVSLVCLPHAGGSASFFFPLASAMPPAVEVFAVQYPGRQDRRADRALEDIGELADRIATAVTALAERTDRPFALFGHSMGAVLGYEVAARLEAAGGPAPAVLFASGRRAPSRPRTEVAPVHLRSDAGIVAEINTLNGTDQRLLADAELLRMILPAIRSDYRAIETYRHRPGVSLRCPVAVFTGDADPHTTVEEAHAWSEHTTGRCTVRVFPGGHFFLTGVLPEIVQAVLHQLQTPTAAAAGV